MSARIRSLLTATTLAIPVITILLVTPVARAAAAQADLDVAIGGPAVFEPGGTDSYTVTVTNDPAYSAVSAVRLDVTLDPSLSFLSYSSSDLWQCTAQSPNTVECTLPGLAAGAQSSVILNVGVAQTAVPGTNATSSATVTDPSGSTTDPGPPDNSAQVTTPIGTSPTPTAPATASSTPAPFADRSPTATGDASPSPSASGPRRRSRSPGPSPTALGPVSLPSLGTPGLLSAPEVPLGSFSVAIATFRLTSTASHAVADNGRLSLRIPAGALPAGTTLTLSAADPAVMDGLLPVSERFVDGYAVGWVEPDGASRNAHEPITLTVSDPDATAADALYRVGVAGIGPQTGSTSPGQWTATFTGDTGFVLVRRLATGGSSRGAWALLSLTAIVVGAVSLGAIRRRQETTPTTD
ncbi:MAG TPA: hypothetical protein VNG13_06490 [Mycobacteriales bacterium]|nr:hypothetical protein [Mycobacteriales bacterium]